MSEGLFSDSMNGKDEFEVESRTSDPMSISSGWQFSAANLTNDSVGYVSTGNHSVISNGDLGVSSCPSTSMPNLFTPTLLNHHTNMQNSGFCSIFNEQNSIVTSNTTAVDEESLNSLRSGSDRMLGMDWNQQNPWMKGVFSANVPGMFPASLSQLPADSAFVERAARFSCFNNGVFVAPPTGPFGISDSISIHSRGEFGRQDDISRNGAAKDVSLPMKFEEAKEKNPPKTEKESERSQDRAKQGCVGESGNESDEAGFSGGQDERCTLEGTITEPSTEGLCSKKRKRGGQVNYYNVFFLLYTEGGGGCF